MKHRLQFLILLLEMIITKTSALAVVECEYSLEQEWDTGFLGKVSIPVAERYSNGWILLIRFATAVKEFDIFEAEIMDPKSTKQPPNNKDFVCKNMDYNHVVYYYKDKVMDMYLQGNQFPSDDRSVYVSPPDAEAIFIPYINPTETVLEALTRAANTPPSQRYGGPSVPISSTESPTISTAGSTTSITTTTRMPWFGWRTEPRNILTPATTQPPKTTPTIRSKPTPIVKRFRYNLREVILKSMLFFEAQRSGSLPITNRILWRSHSALRDGMDKAVDLTGGYYIDSGHIKHGFPMAASITLLAWGAIEFKRGYVASKELGHLLGAIKWGTDYLLKCHADTFSLYAQVSDSNTDNAAWGRPEDMWGFRPSYKITRNRPGSDLAAEVSAAFSSASAVLRETNPKYSQELRNHSVQLFRFADRYRGKYSKTIPDAAKHYASSGYFDELAWAASWLYGITGDKIYLDQAKLRLSQNPDKSPIQRFDWNDKRAAVITLLAQLTNRTEYRLSLLGFCDSMLLGGGSNYTRKGFLFLDDVDTSSLTSNSAFLCLMAANLGIRQNAYRDFAQKQINYLLGDAGRSYMVGYGKNFPKRPYHMASSCPKKPLPCSWTDRDLDAPNPQHLTGAIVSGPDKWDNFADDRNSQSNRVSIYYNAGFQTLAAGILQLQVSMETFSDPEPGELMPSINQKFDHFHDYSQVLRYSLKFYEAQRSGLLPANNRIPWRHSACTEDKGSGRINLSGGYFDGGDYIKFNFPMAFSTTVLAWGMLMYPQAYENAGESLNLRAALRWSTDYFIKCHTGKTELYGQVGSSALEHSHWLRPEDINYIRPAFKITENFPGSELAAETSAAMAATAAVYKKILPTYSQLLIKRAKELHQFADKYRGTYHRSIPDAAKSYPSFNGYKDELVWASIWLYIATDETAYLADAKAKYVQFGLGSSTPENFYWDDKTAGVNVLLARLTKSKKYLSASEKFCDQFRYAKYTPKGLLHRKSWGPFQYSTGASFICMMAADLGINPFEYREFAKKQIHYILGDSGAGSYMVGYGPSPPKQPHHRASSCPSAPDPCNFTALYSKENNPHVLFGAVIGGPDVKDQFVDDRTNARSNRVALVYNAGFQSAVAALKYFQMFPPPPPPTKRTKPRRTTRKSLMLSRSQPSTTTPLPTTANTLKSTATITSSTKLTENSTKSNIYSTTKTESNISISTTLSPQMTEVMNQNTSELITTEISFIQHDNNTLNFNLSSITERFTLPNYATHNRTTTILSPTVLNSTQVYFNGTIQTTTSIPLATPNNGTYSKFCGRLRALQLFDQCVISSTDYQKHEDRRIYRCRFMAFKACVNVQTDECPDGVWGYWPYWNHNTNDSLYFTEEDQNCKDQTTLDIEKCELRGMTWTFEHCYKGVENWNSSLDTEDHCKWVSFGNCVMEYLNHCYRTWKIWKLWNMGLPPDQQFNDADMECSSSRANGSKPISVASVGLPLLLLIFSRILFER